MSRYGLSMLIPAQRPTETLEKNLAFQTHLPLSTGVEGPKSACKLCI